MRIKRLLLYCILATPSVLVAQNRVENTPKGIIYNNEKALNMRLHSFGWNVGYESGKLKTYYLTNYYRLSIGELRHAKEVRKTTEFAAFAPSQGFKSYKYGKQNYAYVLRAAYGKKRYYSEKASRNGVAVGLNYSAGVNLALLKPYYIQIGGARNAENLMEIKYSESTAKAFLDPTNIRGRAPFLTGMNETTVMPGANASVGLHLDWGAFDAYLKALEVGLQLDVFTKKLPIMANTENRPFFLNVYISLQLGKRN